MSRWSETFESFKIPDTIKKLLLSLEKSKADLDSEHETEKRRLMKSLNHIEDFVNTQDREFYPHEALTRISETLNSQQVLGNLQDYEKSPHTIYLENANNAISELCQYMGPIRGDGTGDNVENAYGPIEPLFDSIVQRMQSDYQELRDNGKIIEKDFSELSSKVQGLNDEYEKMRSEINSMLSNWTANYTDAQTKRAEDFSTQQITREARFSEKLVSWNSDAEAALKELVGTQTNNLQLDHDRYMATVDNLLEDIRRMHDTVRTVHGLFGGDAVAGGYQKTAKDEQKAANTWRWISMGSLFLAAVWILVKYIIGFRVGDIGELNWTELATAASLTLVLLGTAGYAARQSRQHRDAYRQMQWFALEVNALDPFISSLEDTDRNALKNQLAQKMFGRNHNIKESADVVIGTGILELFERIAKLFVK